MEKEQKNPPPFEQPASAPVPDPDIKELYQRLKPEMRRPKPGPDAIAAALEAVQRLAAEADAEDAADDLAHELAADPGTVVCNVCEYNNREGTKFCGMCGVSIEDAKKAESQFPSLEESIPSNNLALPLSPFPAPEKRQSTTGPTGHETHHYHHHYHHHYFPGAPEGMYSRPVDVPREAAREEKIRPTAALRGEMSRAEAAVRRVTHEWVLACNTKHLDDLLDLYVSDPLVLRSNYPAVRGASAVREFFFAALDAGLGEVEVDPLRIDVVGDLAYEAGRFSALIPGSSGKRREERGKYLWVFTRQSNGEWKLAADCWSSDLTLTSMESDVPSGAAVKMNQPRKSP